jgi:phage terminase small subunit
MARPLTDKQKLFCKNIIDGMTQKESAIRAGYTVKSADVTASKMLREAKIIEYISFLKQSVEEIFADKAKLALETLLEIMTDQKAPTTSRVKASTEILDRAGYSATQKIKADINTTHSGSITANNQQQIHIIQEIVNEDTDLADRLLLKFRDRQQSLKIKEEQEA